jgi:hypothetical protein
MKQITILIAALILVPFAFAQDPPMPAQSTLPVHTTASGGSPSNVLDVESSLLLKWGAAGRQRGLRARNAETGRVCAVVRGKKVDVLYEEPVTKRTKTEHLVISGSW